MPQTKGIFNIEVPGTWISPDDQLWLALVKPSFVGAHVIENDESRPQALLLARTLLAPDAKGVQKIAVSAPNRSAVVLFPEFAFGSDDFAELDGLVRQQSREVMVFAGFGAVRGDRLAGQILGGHVQCGWQAGLAALDATKRYNAAWCWIHDPRQQGPSSHRCYVLLKNWPEQRHERVDIANFGSGVETVRLDADDCTIFPVICADILADVPNSVHERIAANIRANSLDRKNILVPVLMLDSKPSHAAWRSRLENMIQVSSLKLAIVTCNHISVLPLVSEEDDQCRCLSGAFVSTQQFSPDHRETPHPVRPIKVSGIAGYVLRSTDPGIAAGDFVWREIGLANRFIWLPNMRITLDGASLVDAIASPTQVEMQRWCHRVRCPVWLNSDGPGANFLNAGYAKIGVALKVASVAKAIWPEALTGRELDNNFSRRLDSAGVSNSLRTALDEAYLIAGSVMQAPGYVFEPLTNPGHFHRPEMGDHAARDVVIWSSPDKLTDNQLQTLKGAVLNGRYKRAVVVVARGAGGSVPPMFMRVKPDPTTDVGNGPPPEQSDDIAEPPPAPVFWMSSGELHSLLVNKDWTELPEELRLPRIGEAVEHLLNRVAA